MAKTKTDIMPYNLEAEQSVLGSILIDLEIQYEIVSKLEENDFYLESHKAIFREMANITNTNKPIDLVTLSDAMEKSTVLERAGGVVYLNELLNVTPSSANYEYYLDIIKRDSTLRKLIRSSEKIIKQAKDSTDSAQTLAFAEKNIYDISEQLDTSSLTPISAQFPEVLDKFEKIQKDKNYFQGIKTGFTELDNMTNGLHAGNLIILAARPSVGKTTFSMNIIENMALKENAVCAVFALEMTKDELAQRMLCSVANVSGQDATKGKLKDSEWQQLWQAQRALSKAQIYVDDTSMTTCPEILSKCRRIKSRANRLDCIVVDHIQLMNATKSSDSRQQEVTEISRHLKMIAKELQVPVIALSQLSRLVTSRKGQRPVLSDLRESGAIEQDADIVMFIHRPDMNAEPEDIAQGKVRKNVAEIIIAKNRAGACENFELYFKGERSKFVNIAKSYVNDIVPPPNIGDAPAEMHEIEGEPF